jgi:hypothetical protein
LQLTLEADISALKRIMAGASSLDRHSHIGKRNGNQARHRHSSKKPSTIPTA